MALSGPVRITDISPTGAELREAKDKIHEAIALIETLAPRRASRLRRTVVEIVILATSLPIRSGARRIILGRDFILARSPEALAVAIVIALTEMRVAKAVRHQDRDTQAQYTRRIRLEALDFAAMLPNGARWQQWVFDWLAEPRVEVEDYQTGLVSDLRRYNFPNWLIGLFMLYGRFLRYIIKHVRRWRSSVRAAA